MLIEALHKAASFISSSSASIKLELLCLVIDVLPFSVRLAFMRTSTSKWAGWDSPVSCLP